MPGCTTCPNADPPGAWAFWMPLTKAWEEAADQPDTRRWIEGVASTEDVDLQKENVLMRGLDFQPFLDFGYFNYDHGMKARDLLGIPTLAEVRTVAGKMLFFVKGYLLPVPWADDVWTLMKALDPTPRRLGFSVQGGVLRRDGNTIAQAVVRHVSVTAQPINQNTWATVAKSLAAVASLESGGPLLKEDLDGQLTSLLWGDNKASCGHFDPQTGRFHSLRDAVTHLTKCLGHSPESAKRGILKLRSSGVLM